MIDPVTLKPLKSERQHIVKESFLLMLEMLTASTFMLLDSLFYEALDLIRRHAKIDYLTTGKHDLLLQIKGLFVKKCKNSKTLLSGGSTKHAEAISRHDDVI